MSEWGVPWGVHMNRANARHWLIFKQRFEITSRHWAEAARRIPERGGRRHAEAINVAASGTPPAHPNA